MRSLEFMLAADDEERAKIGKSLDSLDTSLGEALKKFEPLISSAEEKKVYEELLTAVAAYRTTVNDAIAKAKEGQVDAAQELRRTSWVKAADAVRDATDALQKMNRAGAEAASTRAAGNVAAATGGGLVALVVSLVYGLAGMQIVSMMTSLPGLLALARHYLPWLALMPLIGVWCYLFDGLFVGATRGRDMRNSMLVAAGGYFVALSTLPWLGNHALWLALSVFTAARGATLAYVWRREWRADRWFA